MEIKDLIYDVTSNDVYEKIHNGTETFYLGIDPTGDSLHIGHLSALVFAKRLIEKGNKAIFIVGGMTAMIGDPSGKKEERQLLDEKTIKENVDKLSKQLNNFFDQNVNIKNNIDWLNMPLVPFLRDYGKLFNVNNMIRKDIVSSRLETGISYTEFTYQVLQGMDFAHLLEKHNCTIQIGGQDQWGNITAGLDLIRKKQLNKDAYGITIPLITKADGTKFGKTETGTVWINPKKTSPYELYQFLFNTPDDEVLKLVKYLTLINEEKYQELNLEVKNNSKARMAQHYLADEVIKLVHGNDVLLRVKEITHALFSGEIKELTLEELEQCLSDVPTIEINSDISIQDLLVQTSAASSKRQAREFIQNNSIILNGEKIIDEELVIKKENSLHNKVQIIKRGKRKYFVAKYK